MSMHDTGDDIDFFKDNGTTQTAIPATSDPDTTQPIATAPREKTRFRDPAYDEEAKAPTRAAVLAQAENLQRERYGGMNWGAGFFGFMVTVALGLLLAVAAAAAATALGWSGDELHAAVNGNQVNLHPATALAGVAVLVVAYYAGGYVAGRMSRFDGGRQGFGAWVVGMLFVVPMVALGMQLGSQHVSLPAFSTGPLPHKAAALVVGAVVMLVMLVVATVGGKAGCRYHRKVDDAGNP
jgi:hypothetical protein